MPLHFLSPAFKYIFSAISWTLIHSLWQGMLLATVAGCVVFMTKKISTAVRYNLLIGAFLIFIAGIAVTFTVELMKLKPALESNLVVTGLATTPVNGNLLPVKEIQSSITVSVKDFFDNHAVWIVLIWMAVIMWKFMQFTAGLYGVYRLKSKEIFFAGDYWNYRLVSLSRQLSVRKKVRLLESGIARVPAVIGYFKPVILFPVGMLTSLPPGEVEAILLHELAHIRRSDFLINLVQHLAEIIFFFNPAVTWVSGLIRSERENCCDDMALCQTTDKRSYINALVSFQEFSSGTALPLTNHFANEKNHLMNRIKRIINNNNKTLNNMEKKFLAAGLIITSAFIFAFSAGSLQPEKAVKKFNPLQVTSVNKDTYARDRNPPIAVKNDTIPDRIVNTNNVNGTINTTLNHRRYKMVTANGGITQLYIDGKQIPAEKISGYKAATDKIFAQLQSDRDQSETDLQQAQKEMAEAKINQEEVEKNMKEAQLQMEKAKEEMEQDRLLANKEMEQANKEMEQSNKEMEQAKLEMETARLDNEHDMEKAKMEMEQAKKNMQLTKNQIALTKIQVEQSKKAMAQSMKQMEQSRKIMEQSEKDIKASEKLQEGMVKDLINEKIINTKEELHSFKMSNKELLVNGIRQPDAIFKKFKANYPGIGNRTMEFNYSYNDDDEVK